MPLFEGVNIVGRGAECQVKLIGTSVSRAHARIMTSASGALIEDLGSTNATFVAERRVSEPIRIGKERLRFVSSEHMHAPTEPEHQW